MKYKKFTCEIFAERDGISWKLLDGSIDENRDCFSPEHLQAFEYPAKNTTDGRRLALDYARQYATFHGKAIY